MKNKRVIIIIFAILAALLIAGGVIYTISDKEPKKEEPEKPEKLKVEVDKEAAEHAKKALTSPLGRGSPRQWVGEDS